MSRKAFSIRPRADAEFDAALDRYLIEAGAGIAQRFLDAVKDAHTLIAESPGIGAPELGQRMAIEGLRIWRIAGFPYLVLYLEGVGGVEVVRFLHAHRDVPTALLDDAE